MSLRLLCITAHPDDETGSFGGALMQAKARGVETSVVCLTDGSAGSHRGNARSEEELGTMRRQEFAAALRVLGVDHGEVLDYPDGKLWKQDFAEVVEKLIERIRRFRPQIVLTYGGDGNVNLHPDHSMVSFFATAAFHWAGRNAPPPPQTTGDLSPYRPQKLYYSITRFLAHVSAEETREIPLTPSSLTIKLGDLTARKVQAFREHRTQGAILQILGPVFEKYADEEGYLLAAAPGVRILSPEQDMFEGIRDN